MKTEVYNKCVSLLGSHRFVSCYRALEVCMELYVGPESLVLDAGCGSNPWTSTGSNIYCIGLDVNHESVKKAHHHIKNFGLGNISCVVGDIEKLPFVEKTFDAVMSRDVLEHVSNPENAINELAFCLKTGGKLLVTTSNSFNPTMFVDSLLPKSISNRIIRKLGVSRHERHQHLNPWSLARNIRNNGLAPKSLMCGCFQFNRPKALRSRSLEPNKILFYIWTLFDGISNMSFLRYFKEIMLIFAEKGISNEVSPRKTCPQK